MGFRGKMTRKEVMKRIEKEIRVFSIRIKGSKKDKTDAFYILMNTQDLFSDERDVFHRIKQSTLDLLDEAKINYEIIEGERPTAKRVVRR